MTTVVDSPKVRAPILALVLALVLAFVPAPPAEASVEFTGTLPNGTTWRAVVPDQWNGTLLLYSHGYAPSFIPPTPAVAPDFGQPVNENALLGLGYALAGSSYSTGGWALPTAAFDQLETLDVVIEAIGQEPNIVLAYGSSMGGLVTAQLAEIGGDVIDGALPTCGLVAGGVDLQNYQLDAAHAINELLAPDVDIQLVGYANGFFPGTEGAIATEQLVTAVEQGQTTPQGRARVALAAAFQQVPDWVQGQDEPPRRDLEARQDAMYQNLLLALNFVTSARSDVVAAAGGLDSGWNKGVNYRRLFLESPERSTVMRLYREAGLNLWADLGLLTNTADFEKNDAALEAMQHSVVEGDLRMPVFSIHTTDDFLVPAQQEEEYAEDVRSERKHQLLRQAFVDRSGHCAFTTAELVAGLNVLEDRVSTGHWNAASVSPHKLNALAESLDLGESAFVAFRPGEFIGDRGDTLRH